MSPFGYSAANWLGVGPIRLFMKLGKMLTDTVFDTVGLANIEKKHIRSIYKIK